MQQNRQANLFFAALMVLALVAGYLLLRPFLILIGMSVIIALMYKPVYSWIRKKIGKRSGIAASLTVAFIFLSVIIPVAVVLGIVTAQVVSISEQIRDSGTISSESISIENVVTEANLFLEQFPAITYRFNEEEVTTSIQGLIAPVGNFAVNNLITIGSSALNLFTALIIFSSVASAVLINHSRILKVIHTISPLPNEIDRLYFTKLTSMATAMVKGTFIVALAQSLACGIFAWIAGLDYIALIMLITFILSFLPLGSGFLMLPLGVAQILSGSPIAGVFLIVSFVLIVSNIDNVLRPKLVPKDAELHPALTVLGLFAGLQAFGFLGVIFGPIVMIFIVTTMDVYVRDFKEYTPKVNRNLATQDGESQ